MTERFFKLPLFYLSNEEILSGKNKNNIYNFELSRSGFPRSRNIKEQEFQIFFSHSLLFSIYHVQHKLNKVFLHFPPKFLLYLMIFQSKNPCLSWFEFFQFQPITYTYWNFQNPQTRKPEFWVHEPITNAIRHVLAYHATGPY